MEIPVIAVTNASTCVSDAQVEAALPALQRQVSQDFKAYWNADCSLIVVDKNHGLPDGWWQIVVLDNPDQAGALGYHELAENGAPLGKVFAGLDLKDGYSWTVTLSHELLEMLADPWINWCAAASDGKIYALEVCDPVEADNLGYEIDGVLVSDFVTPAWFESPTVGRVDFKQRISHPLQLASGGYISVFDENKGWTQISADAANVSCAPQGSRRERRTVAHDNWNKSDSASSKH